MSFVNTFVFSTKDFIFRFIGGEYLDSYGPVIEILWHISTHLMRRLVARTRKGSDLAKTCREEMLIIEMVL